MKVNKKGQEMSVATLVLIVIGIVVLVMLILGFSMGWKNLWGKISGVSGSDVETAIQSCSLAATSDSTYTYCSDWRKVTIDGKVQYVTCTFGTISDHLDKKLPCSGVDAVGDKCKALLAAVTLTDKVAVDRFNTDTTLYDGKTCKVAGYEAKFEAAPIVAGADGAPCTKSAECLTSKTKTCIKTICQ
jgi:hypothetical protein